MLCLVEVEGREEKGKEEKMGKRKENIFLWGVWILDGKEVRNDEDFCLVYKKRGKENVYFYIHVPWKIKS